MELAKIISKLEEYLILIDDDDSLEALEIIRTKPQLDFYKQCFNSEIDYGLIEQFASRCYYAKLNKELLKYEDVDYLENICSGNVGNFVFCSTFNMYNYLTTMCDYFDGLDMDIAARDLYKSYVATVKVSRDLLDCLQSNIVSDTEFKVLAKTLLAIYEGKTLDVRAAYKGVLEHSANNADLSEFENHFSDMCTEMLNIEMLTCTEFSIILSELTNTIDKISDDLPDDVLRVLLRHFCVHTKSEEDLKEKENRLIKKVNERI